MGDICRRVQRVEGDVDEHVGGKDHVRFLPPSILGIASFFGKPRRQSVAGNTGSTIPKNEEE